MKKLTELLKTSNTWLTRVRKKAHSGHFLWFCIGGGGWHKRILDMKQVATPDCTDMSKKLKDRLRDPKL